MTADWHPMAPGAFYALVSTYAGLAIYGVTSFLTGLLSLFVAFGQEWETVWPILLFGASIITAAAAFRTQRTGKQSFEVLATSLLVGLLLVYGLAVIFRHAAIGSWDGVSFAILPILLCIAPFFRLIDILPHKKEA